MPVQTPSISTRWVRNQYDTAPPIRLTVYDEDGNPVLLEANSIGAKIDIAFASSDHYWAPYMRLISDRPMTVVGDDQPGVLAFIPAPGDLAHVGEFHVKVVILYPDDTQQTIPDEYPLQLTVKPRVGGP